MICELQTSVIAILRFFYHADKCISDDYPGLGISKSAHQRFFGQRHLAAYRRFDQKAPGCPAFFSGIYWRKEAKLPERGIPQASQYRQLTPLTRRAAPFQSAVSQRLMEAVHRWLTHVCHDLFDKTLLKKQLALCRIAPVYRTLVNNRRSELSANGPPGRN
jgi:hypothetical protein